MEKIREDEFNVGDSRMETNRAVLQGHVLTELEFSHKSYGETFYIFEMGLYRKSGYIDEIKVIISERLIWNTSIKVNDKKEKILIYLSTFANTKNSNVINF